MIKGNNMMNARNRQELESKKEGTVPKPRETVAVIPDISDSVLHRFKANNILLLNMSILRSDGNITESSYCYNGITVKGFGQLEAVPKLLIKEGKTPDIIIILASAATRKEVDFSIQSEDSTIAKRGSAVDFFKEQIAEASGNSVSFKVVELDKRNASHVEHLKNGENREQELNKKDVVSAVGNVVDIIRLLKRNNEKINLYLDIHGGPREDQVVIEAIINLLAMEDICITDAFSISGGGQNVPIMNVTELFKIFNFVSAMNEFTNFGLGKSIKEYVSGLSREAYEDEFYKEISNGIGRISDALLLCRVNEFESALDSMQKIIEKRDHKIVINDYLDIFIKNIKNNYGVLLQKNKRNLQNEVLWAYKKGFYQQCLAIIEAKTPEYVFTNFFEYSETDGVKCEIWNKQNNCRKKQISKRYFLNRISRGRCKDSVESQYEYLSKTLLYSKQKINQRKIYEVIDYELENNRKDNRKEKYDIIFYCKFTQGEDFAGFLKEWKVIKEIRNNVMHLREDKKVSINQEKVWVTLTVVHDQIKEYLRLLNKLKI